MSTVLGIKPLMDAWISVDRLEEFKKICKQYGLKIREGIIFFPISKKYSGRFIRKESLTTKWGSIDDIYAFKYSVL